MKSLGTGVEVEDYLAQSVQIEPLALQEEYVRLPGDVAYWNERYAVALRAHLVLKIDYEKAESRVRIETRETMLADTAAKSKPTESMIDAAVAQDEDLRDLRIKLIEAEVEKVRLHGVLEAVRTKRDMLISLGAHVRQEMDHDPVVREQQAGHAAVRGTRGF